MWPALALVWLVGLVVWANRDNWWGPSRAAPYPTSPLPMSTTARHLRTSERDGVRVWDLRRLAQHGGDGTFARSVLIQDRTFYSEHLMERGRLAVALDAHAGTVETTGWAFGWPWSWASHVETAYVPDPNLRERDMSKPDTYPPSRTLRPLRGQWLRYPGWGSVHSAYDLAPVVVVAFLAWLAGRIAWVCTRRAGERVRVVARWGARVGVVVVALGTSAAGARTHVSLSGGATGLPLLTELSMAEAREIAAGPDADRRMAEALLKVVPADADVGTYVLTCVSVRSLWWFVNREASFELPFAWVAEVRGEDPDELPRTSLRHWQWMVWGVWNTGGPVWGVQVYLDRAVYCLGPCWVLWAGGPALVGLVRWRVAARRWKRGLCTGCGYPRASVAESAPR